MIRRPSRSTRTDTPVPYTTPCRSRASRGARLLIGALGQCHSLHADGEPCVVHHGEHAGYALVLFADQVADRAARIAVGHHCSGRGLDAQFMLDRHAAQIVVRSQAAVFVDDELRHQEEADALGALRRSEEHTSELQSLMRISYAVFCLKKKKPETKN